MRRDSSVGAACRLMMIVLGVAVAASVIGVWEASASTKPYKINGRWYSPHGATGYDRVGVASWYGPGFHGRKTANGERYDQWGWTAAHPTLPMGTQVYITNQRTGKTVKARINDRGPFTGGRIIDLSRSVAEALGIRSTGLGTVRVRYAGLGAPSDDRRTYAKNSVGNLKVAERSKSVARVGGAPSSGRRARKDD